MLAAVAEMRPSAVAPEKTDRNRQAVEFELLLACCRAELSGTGVAPHIRRDLDWAELLKMAEHHRVLPAIYAALHEHPEVTPAARSTIRERFRKHVQRSLRLSAELCRILQAFEAHGIETLPYKGPTLAHYLFGDVTMRQFGDLDVLVHVSDVLSAGAVLQSLGYTRNLGLSPRHEKEYLRVSNELGFGCELGANLIELQWQILPRWFAIEFDIESLFSRSTRMKFEGRCIRALAKEDLMLILCAHAAKHEWEQLGMVRDVAKLARLDLDWKWITSEACRLGISRIVTISLLLARDLLECEFSAVVFGRASGQLAELFESRFRACEYADTKSLAYFWDLLSLRERWRDRARTVCRLALTPNVGEWNSVAIPGRFSGLYRGVRILRVCGRFLT